MVGGGNARVDLRLKLRLALIGIHAVLLLLHVIKLGVAEGAGVFVAEQGLREPAVAVCQLLLGGGPVAVAPAVRAFIGPPRCV